MRILTQAVIASFIAIASCVAIAVARQQLLATPPSPEPGVFDRMEKEIADNRANVFRDVQAYAKAQGMPCGVVTGYQPIAGKLVKYNIACDGGATWYNWTKLASGEVIIQPLY